MAKKLAKNKKEEKESLDALIPVRTAYVIMNVHFEYDDNYYNSSEDEGGSPQKVYLDRKRAEQVYINSNINALESHDLTSYSWRLRENGSAKEEFKDAARKHGCKIIESEDGYDIKIEFPDDEELHTKEMVDEIMESINISFFKLEEIELEMYMD